jgi:hypothetical protein
MALRDPSPLAVFVSSSDDPSQGDALVESLRARGARVTRSPVLPDDPRWNGWYDSRCERELAEVDAFIGLVTYGYDSSTWMAHEISVADRLARETGRPVVYLHRSTDRPLAAAFRRYEAGAIELPSTVAAAAALVTLRTRLVAAARVVDLIHQARGCGVIRGGSSDATELSRAAESFGLSTDPAIYSRVDRHAAREILASLLHRDLAYRAELMPRAVAHALAERFLACLGDDAELYSNGVDPSLASGTTWMPATAATFDTGILALMLDGSACLWVEDED